MVHQPIIYRPLSYSAHRLSSSADDGQQNFVVGFLLALIALVLLLVIGIAIRHMQAKAGAGPVAAAAAATATTASGGNAQAGGAESKPMR